MKTFQIGIPEKLSDEIKHFNRQKLQAVPVYLAAIGNYLSLIKCHGFLVIGGAHHQSAQRAISIRTSPMHSNVVVSQEFIQAACTSSKISDLTKRSLWLLRDLHFETAELFLRQLLIKRNELLENTTQNKLSKEEILYLSTYPIVDPVV